MIIRIVRTRGRAGSGEDVIERPQSPTRRDAAADVAAENAHGGRLKLAAGRIDGLETLIVGWRGATDADLAAAEAAPSVVVTVWRDVESMLAAFGRDEVSAIRTRLGLDIDIQHAESYEVMSRTFASLPAPTAVLRVLTMSAKASGDAALFERLREIQQRLTSHGLIASHVARRMTGDGLEALVVGVWGDEAAIEAATGGRPDRPVAPAELEPWIQSVSIETYRALEIAPRLPMASGPPIIVLDQARRVVDLTPAAAAAIGRIQEEAVGVLVAELAGAGDPEASRQWARLLSEDADGDRIGQSAWLVPPGGIVMIRWRFRRNAPVHGRHTLLVRRVQDAEPTQGDLDAALAEAFPPET